MMEKLSAEEIIKAKWFDENYIEVESKIRAVCERKGIDRKSVLLLAATKTVPVAVINHAIENGINYIGENRVQEFLSKKDELSSDAHRHFIGHLQTNKVKDIVGLVEMIESVHSLKLAAEIDKTSKAKGIVTDILVEVNIGNEESKSGFLADEVMVAVEKMSEMSNIKVKGLMTIPPICQNDEQLAEYFAKMRKLFIDIRDKKVDNVNMEYLSMGMSDDYELAIEHGANIVRVGTKLFGERIYNNK